MTTAGTGLPARRCASGSRPSPTCWPPARAPSPQRCWPPGASNRQACRQRAARAVDRALVRAGPQPRRPRRRQLPGVRGDEVALRFDPLAYTLAELRDVFSGISGRTRWPPPTAGRRKRSCACPAAGGGATRRWCSRTAATGRPGRGRVRRGPAERGARLPVPARRGVTRGSAPAYSRPGRSSPPMPPANPQDALADESPTAASAARGPGSRRCLSPTEIRQPLATLEAQVPPEPHRELAVARSAAHASPGPATSATRADRRRHASVPGRFAPTRRASPTGVALPGRRGTAPAAIPVPTARRAYGSCGPRCCRPPSRAERPRDQRYSGWRPPPDRPACLRPTSASGRSRSPCPRRARSNRRPASHHAAATCGPCARLGPTPAAHGGRPRCGKALVRRRSELTRRAMTLDLSAITDSLIDLVKDANGPAPLWAEVEPGAPGPLTPLHAELQRARARPAAQGARSAAQPVPVPRRTQQRRGVPVLGAADCRAPRPGQPVRFLPLALDLYYLMSAFSGETTTGNNRR